MKPPRFDYARPDTLGAALAMLAQHGDGAAVLAGGQSLMPMLNLRMTQPALLLDINRIPGLDAITAHEGGLTIGARARHAAVLASPLVRAHAPLLTEALGHVAHAAIRNRGTLGGSLALADPAAELPACAVCLGATIVTAHTLNSPPSLVGGDWGEGCRAHTAGESDTSSDDNACRLHPSPSPSLKGRGEDFVERRHPAGRFFTGLYATARAPNELIVRIEIPNLGRSWRYAFAEVARRHGDYAIAGLAFAAQIEQGRIAACRIAFCGVEPAPRRLGGAEAALISGGRDAALRALDELEPMGSDEAPAAFRRHLAGVLLGRAIDRVLAP